MPIEPTTPSLLAFLAVVAFVAAAVLAAVALSSEPDARARRTGIAAGLMAAWMGLTLLPTALGIFDPQNPIPAIPLTLMTWLALGTALALSTEGRRWAEAVPLWALVAFQGFRLPLELVLHTWVDQGVVPHQMTWGGANPDIASGIVALLLAPLVVYWRPAAWIAQGVGVVLLLNVIRVVMQSFPTPLQMYDEPVLLALGIPEVWIASVAVVGAWTGHVVALRALTLPVAPPRAKHAPAPAP